MIHKIYFRNKNMVQETRNEEISRASTPKNAESFKFTRDILWFTVAQLFVSVILGIITLPALTKTYPPDIYGIWIQVSVTVILISPLLSLQLNLAVVRYLAGQEDKTKRRQALGAMLSAIIVTGCIVSLAGFFLKEQLSILLFASPEYVNFVMMTIVWTFFNSLLNFFIAYLRVRGKIKEISISSVAITVAQMISIVFLARAGAGLELIIIFMIALQIIFSVGYFAWIVRDIGLPVPNILGLKTYLAFSVPQMPVIILLWIISLSDRYFITHFLGLSENGIYSSSNTLANLTSLFYMPVSFVLFPLISRLWAQKRLEDVKSYFEYSIKFFLTLAIPGAIGIAFLSQPLLRILTTSEFLVGRELVLLLAFGAIFLGLFQIGMNLILLSKNSKLLPLFTAAASVASVVINLLLIPRIGIIGAAISNCSSYFVLAAIITIWARKIINLKFNFKYYSKIVASSLAVAACLFFLKADSIGGIILSVVVGSVVFIMGLLLLKALTRQDQKMIGNVVGSLIPGYFKKRM